MSSFYTVASGEKFNAYSHLLGTLLASVGLVGLLIPTFFIHKNALHGVSAVIYGVSLVGLYACSTLYHSIKRPKLKQIFQKIDHCAIYLLIAGSYTPFSLVALQQASLTMFWHVVGWGLFGSSWLLAVFGILQELTLGKKTRRLSMILYVLMGWIGILVVYPLVQVLSKVGLFWLILGGLLYSGGIYWFINDEKIKHGHGIWHLFVLGGSLAHFICIYGFVLNTPLYLKF